MRQQSSPVLGLRALGSLFACVGCLAPQKNQAPAVEASARLGSRGLDAELMLVGDGDDWGALEALARRLGVDGRVRITGELADAVRVFSREVDAVLVTSRCEGQPHAVAEAESFGLPVLASGGVPESAWIASHSLDRRGLPLDPEVWADAMAGVMADLTRGRRVPIPMASVELDSLPRGLAEGSLGLVNRLEGEIAERGRAKRGDEDEARPGGLTNSDGGQ